MAIKSYQSEVSLKQILSISLKDNDFRLFRFSLHSKGLVGKFIVKSLFVAVFSAESSLL